MTDVDHDEAKARDSRLVGVLSRARRGSAQPERWLITLGGALAAAGIVLVVVGWIGTSRTVLVAGQIPYVVSGGLLGLGLMFLGGFLYFGYWLALLVRQTSEQRDQARDDLTRIESTLAEAAHSLALIAGAMQDDTATNGGRQRRLATAPLLKRRSISTITLPADRLVATDAGTMAHRPECSIVANRSDLRDVPPDGSGLRPCGLCNPRLRV